MTSISMCAIICNTTPQPRPPAIAGIAPNISTAARALSLRCRTIVFRNDRGRFVDVTAEAGIVDPDGRGLGVVAADLDEDGKTDLFVANDYVGQLLLPQPGRLSFRGGGSWLSGLATSASGGYLAGMGVACGDYDGDGRLDLAVTNFFGESTTLYHNHGRGLFSDRSAAAGLAAPTRFVLGFGLVAARREQRRPPRPGAGQRPRRRFRRRDPLRDARAALSGRRRRAGSSMSQTAPGRLGKSPGWARTGGWRPRQRWPR